MSSVRILSEITIITEFWRFLHNHWIRITNVRAENTVRQNAYINVLFGHLFPRHEAGHGEQHDRKESRDCDWERLGRPVDCHQNQTKRRCWFLKLIFLKMILNISCAFELIQIKNIMSNSNSFDPSVLFFFLCVLLLLFLCVCVLNSRLMCRAGWEWIYLSLVTLNLFGNSQNEQSLQSKWVEKGSSMFNILSLTSFSLLHSSNGAIASVH